MDNPNLVKNPVQLQKLLKNKTQGFRVELQVSGGGGVTGKGQDSDDTGAIPLSKLSF